MVTVMGKPGKINSSESIGRRNAATNTRGSRVTKKVNIIDARGTSIYGTHRRIRVRHRRSGYGRYRILGAHFVETII